MDKFQNTTNKQGFTLVELSISLVFIGVLSLIIALIITDTISTYRHGLTLNQINTVGMDLVDDIRTAFQNSTAKSVTSDCESIFSNTEDRNNCENANGAGLISVIHYDSVTIRGVSRTSVPVFGAICTGSYSYIWNSGYFFDDQYTVAHAKPARLGYLSKENAESGKLSYEGSHEFSASASGENIPFKLLKVQDKKRAICTYSSLNLQDSYSNIDTLRSAVEKPSYRRDIDRDEVTFYTSPYESISDPPVRLLTNDENGTALALYKLVVNTPFESNANKGMFYSASFILGTIEGGIDIKQSGNFCATPEDYTDANFDYCSINKFSFSVQTTGEGK